MTPTFKGWLTAAMVALLAAAFVLFGVDALSLMVRGGASPDRILYVETDRNGLASMDAVLDSFAKENSMFVSRANFGEEFGQPRELWRPGIRIIAMNEFGCRAITEPAGSMSKTLFGVSITRVSFLADRADSERLAAALRAKIAASKSVRELSERRECPPPLV